MYLPSLLRRWLKRLEVDRAVFYGILLQIWSVASGPFTMLVIASWLTPTQQGYYYTFNSLVVLQVFVELGLGTVIVQTASHEWANLSKDPSGAISGESGSISRLASLLRFSLGWYAVAGLVLLVVLGTAGSLFLSGGSDPGVSWQVPWLAFAFLISLSLPLVPLTSILLGCGEVAPVYAFRFVQGAINTGAVIVSIILGAGLFALPIAALARFLCGVVFLLWRYRHLLLQLVRQRIVERIDWRTEIWPFQWRLAVSVVSGFFVYALFTPVMFHYHGPEVAGRMGMTLSLVGLISAFGYNWVQTRFPRFGVLAARKEYSILDRLFWKLTFIGAVVTLAGSVALVLVFVWLRSLGVPIAQRILTPLPLSLMLVGGFFETLVIALGFYLRAHKREPLMWLHLSTGVLMGLLAWQFGSRYGPLGASLVYLGVCTLIRFPGSLFVFYRSRARWHDDAQRPYPTAGGDVQVVDISTLS